jgi:ribosome recycling factor
LSKSSIVQTTYSSSAGLLSSNMSISLSQSARQLLRLSRSQVPRSVSPAFAYPTSFAGPRTLRPLSTTPPTWKKATKTSGAKASKAVSRQEVENVDYEDADLDKTLSKVGSQMEKAVNWAKALVYESVERGRGRVSPCKFLLSD